jgi:hypothetical protein
VYVSTPPLLLGNDEVGAKVVVIVSEPDARAAPGTNANTPATPTNKTTARARPCAINTPVLCAQLKIIWDHLDPKSPAGLQAASITAGPYQGRHAPGNQPNARAKRCPWRRLKR